LLTWTTDYLKQRGSESPRLDAEVLLASAKGCERIMLYAAFDEVVSDEVRAKFRDLVKRRAEGTPVAYLVGKKEFYSLALRVTPDVLIPRPETEHVVLAVLDVLGEGSPKSKVQSPMLENAGESSDVSAIQNPKSKIQNPLVADVGTGSGAIAIAVAKHAPAVRIMAIDVSSVALEVARGNAAQHGVSDRIEFVEGDLLTSLPPQARFAVIASNPPYVSEGEFAALSPQIRNHEPRGALVAGPTGSEVIERLIPQASERLLPGGWLIVELSPMIAARVVGLIAADGRYEPATLIKDLAGLARVVKAKRKA
jgi:release factor glutamine methyltransferase